MPTARRFRNGFLQFLVLCVLLLRQGGWEHAATAQSPVNTQLPIKSVRIYLCSG